ncbi:MAG: nucleotidyltransferase domain-containing protein [Planctomycetes bacterium]|nr:nucleotidyltransferase domain-containing protein [Planctomycetota bacterium]
MIVRSVPREEVISTLKEWTKNLSRNHPEVRRVGIFGSYARGDYTPASDVDVIVVVSESGTPIRKRSLDYPPPPGAVGAEVFVYTEAELAAMQRESSPWIRRILGEVVWL